MHEKHAVISALSAGHFFLIQAEDAVNSTDTKENTAEANDRKTKASETFAKTAEKMKGKVEEPTFTVISDATPLRERALKLLGLYPVR